jgi:hypothetical protein
MMEIKLYPVRDTEDTFNVYNGRKPIGEIALMADGWAAYKVGPHGCVPVGARRVGTYRTTNAAIEALS